MAKILKDLDKPIMGLNRKSLTELDGTVIVPGKLLGEVVGRGVSKDPIRAVKIAIEIYGAKGKVEIEDADFDMVKAIVTEDQMLYNVAKAALLEVLNSAEEKKK